MPLLELWEADKHSILKMTIEQITTISGDGKLLDNSECQQELRTYFSEVTTDTLASYANYCLENPFNKSGLILQDIVNELGRRLEYTVENGRYQGVKNAIGFDGIWRDQSNNSLVIEVKTTDAYRLSLDTIASYRDSLISEGTIQAPASVLIVVGRTDTGELEAQVRGSKHAWLVRIVGVDSLIRLINVKESADNQETVRKIRTLLSPIEYTRIDELVDVVFAAVSDIDESTRNEPVEIPAPSIDGIKTTDKTSAEVIATIRDNIINAASDYCNSPLIKKTRALYWSPDHAVRMVCTISKRYENQGIIKYWYAYHPSWDEFLADGDKGYLVLGCVDLDKSFMIPLDTVREQLAKLNITSKKNGTMYWHIKLSEPQEGDFFFQLPNQESDLSLSSYELAVSTHHID